MSSFDPDWDARFYDRVMGHQQLAAAAPLLAAVPQVGLGTIIDAGCGSGLVAEILLERHPQARLVAVDLSAAMLKIARARLRERFGARVQFQKADLQTFFMPKAATCILSNAAMHWVPDHPRMFANQRQTLIPGGLLATQFAWGGPYNARLIAYMRQILSKLPFDAYFSERVWNLETINPAQELKALQQAGFVDITMTPHVQILRLPTIKSIACL